MTGPGPGPGPGAPAAAPKAGTDTGAGADTGAGTDDPRSGTTPPVRRPAPRGTGTPVTLLPQAPTPGPSAPAPAAPHGGDTRPAPGLLRLVREDLHAVLDRDPSCSGRPEALLHAGWQGLALYRLAHRLHRRGHRLRAALTSRLARLLTGMEIHPGARIGRRAFIDHGFGVVIGETAVIGDDVTLYHGVTLGSRGWLRDGAATRRRHPVVGDGVLIGTGASVLGPVTVGDGCRIAAHALVLDDLPARGTTPRRTKAPHPRR
ncbi:serine O-acetyltransferase EpsC [Streptomyces sp. NPDC018964]|uniref:serine O-acetyltransferase EpsC n=1 Tax=unclassified Streptomyces TaxID=2593676 RepID=UPI0037AC03A1